MIDLFMTFQKMKEEIKFINYIVNETISPVKTPKNFGSFMGGKYLPLDFYFKNLTEIILQKSYNSNGTLCNAVEDMIFNAFERGNNYDENLDIYVKLARGEKGFALNVEDSGEGFDLKEKLKLMKENKKYFKREGRGLRNFSEINEIVSFEGKNNIVSLMYKSKNK